MRLVAVVLEDEGVDLLLQELDVGCQREDVLDRPVVEVEAEPHQPPFGRRDERALARRRVLEEMLALDDRAQRGCRLEQVRVGDGLLGRADASDDRGVRLAEAEHGRRPELRAAEERETRPLAQRRLRLGARPAAGTAFAAERDDAVEPARRARPERDVAQHVEAEQQPELELDRQERRQLEQARVPDDLAEEDVARGRQGKRAGLGDDGAGSAHVGLVELERSAQLDDRRRRVPDRREAVPDLVVPVARVDAPGVGEDRLRAPAGSRPCSLRGSTRGAARGAPRARGRPDVRAAGNGGGAPSPRNRCACLPRSCCELPPHLREFSHEFNAPASPAAHVHRPG